MPDNWEAEARPYAVATTGSRTWGVMFRGLNAALVGSVDTAVARFDAPPIATTRRLSNAQDPASSALVDPVAVVTTAAAGTTFSLARRGLWAVDAIVHKESAAGAVSLLAALSVDAIAADLVVATTPVQRDGDRIVDANSVTFVAGAGASAPVRLYAPVISTAHTRPVIRLLLSNGAGGAPAAIVLASVSIGFTWLRDRA